MATKKTTQNKALKLSSASSEKLTGYLGENERKLLTSMVRDNKNWFKGCGWTNSDEAYLAHCFYRMKYIGAVELKRIDGRLQYRVTTAGRRALICLVQ